MSASAPEFGSAKPALEIRPFDSDYRQLRRMIQQAWAAEHTSHLDFTEPYLQFLVESPDTEPTLTLGAYQNGALISFIFSRKKRLTIYGKEYLALQQTLGTTHPDHAHRFPYLKLKTASIKAAVDHGYDLNYGFIAWGIANNRIERFFAEKKGYRCSRVHTFGWLGYSTAARLPAAPGGSSDIRLRRLEPADIDECLQIINRSTDSCAIFQKWDRITFHSRFFHRDGSEGRIVSRDGQPSGFIGWSQFDILTGHSRVSVGFIYHLFLDLLKDSEKQAAIGAVIEALKDAGVDVISVPDTGYVNCGFLKRMGFKTMPFNRYKTHLSVTMFGNGPAFGSDEPFYLEII